MTDPEIKELIETTGARKIEGKDDYQFVLNVSVEISEKFLKENSKKEFCALFRNLAEDNISDAMDKL